MKCMGVLFTCISISHLNLERTAIRSELAPNLHMHRNQSHAPAFPLEKISCLSPATGAYPRQPGFLRLVFSTFSPSAFLPHLVV